MLTVTGLVAAAWRVAPHSAFLGRKDDLRRVADAIALVLKVIEEIRCYPLFDDTQSFLRGLRLEKWCSSWHIRSCTCWGHTRTRDMSCVVETGLLEMNGCALVAAISQSSCHPLFCPVSGKYIFSLLFFCVYHVKLAKETFSSLRDDVIVQKYQM